MKKEALFKGAEVTPSSSTCGTLEGKGLGSEYCLSWRTAGRCVAMVGAVAGVVRWIWNAEMVVGG